MAKAKFLEINGDKFYPYAHAGATYTKDGSTVQEALDRKLEVVNVTLAQYEELTDEEKNNPYIMYNITDAPNIELTASEVVYNNEGTDITSTTVQGAITELSNKQVTQVQADWNETNSELNSYIKNKPTSLPASDVHDWAKEENKPTYTADEVGAIASTEKGVANGVATLDESGIIPSSFLPSYVDDVIEHATKEEFPEEGESGKIYVETDTNITYRWSGTTYVAIGSDLALGETSSTAYAGDKGKALADKLNGIEEGAEKNVQSDWNETDVSKGSFIKNKPGSLAIEISYEDFMNLSEEERNKNDYLVTDAPSSTTIDGIVEQIGEINEAVSGKAEAEHKHDDRYYTENEVDEKVGQLNLYDVELQIDGYVTPIFGTVRNSVEGNVYHKRIGRVDMGTLFWQYGFYENVFYTILPKIKTNTLNGLCEKYTIATGSIVPDEMDDMSISTREYYNPHSIHIKDSHFDNNVDEFSKSLNGVYLYYELAEEEIYSLLSDSIIDKTEQEIIDLKYGEKAGGINLVDNSKNQLGFYYNVYGKEEDYNKAMSSLVSVTVGETYTGSIFDANGNYLNTAVYMTFDTNNPTKALRSVTTSSITIEDGEKYIAIRNYNAQSDYITNNNYLYQLEKGTVHSEYQPYVKSNKMLTDGIGAIGNTVNLLNPTLRDTVVNGITVHYENGTYTLNGTATESTMFTLQNNINLKYNEQYRFVGTPIISDNVFLRISDNVEDSYFDNGTGKTFINKLTKTINLYLHINSGYTCNNLVFKPMLTTNLSATVDDFVQFTGTSGQLNKDVAELNTNMTENINFLKTTKVNTITDGYGYSCNSMIIDENLTTFDNIKAAIGQTNVANYRGLITFHAAGGVPSDFPLNCNKFGGGFIQHGGYYINIIYQSDDNNLYWGRMTYSGAHLTWRKLKMETI